MALKLKKRQVREPAIVPPLLRDDNNTLSFYMVAIVCHICIQLNGSYWDQVAAFGRTEYETILLHVLDTGSSFQHVIDLNAL